MFHIDNIVHVTHIVDEVSIAVGNETKLFEVCELLDELVTGGEFVDFKAVGLQVGRNKAQLAHQTGGTLIDMCRDKQTTNTMHLLVNTVNVHIDGIE